MFALYTPQTANEALPEVQRIFSRIVNENKRIVTLHSELQALAEGASSFESFMKKKQELNAAISALYHDVEILEDKGVLIKSIEQGLLDFPSKRFDEEVWLCWKDGEHEVKFWHGKDEGFMGRKPLVPSGFPKDDTSIDPSELERLK